MKTIRANDGGYLLNAKQFSYTKDEQGRPVLNVQSVTGGDFKADGTVPMTGNLYMDGNSIMGVNSISNTNSGIAIESEVSLNNHKITDLLDPTENQDAATKTYVDGKVPTKVSELSNDAKFIVAAEAPVQSVNKKTGSVSLTASDVGALPSTTKIPTKTSELENDAGFLTNSAVKSVNGKTGVVTLVAGEIGAVPTTRTVAGHTLSANVTLVKGDVGLGNVDNTSDADKPVSTATQTALDDKVSTTRKVNGKALSADITLTATDVGAATKAYVDEHSLLGDNGKVDSDLDMNEHGIINAHRISTDGPAPLYIGSTIEDSGTNAPRLTGSNDGTAAFVKADTQSTYVAVSVGAPTATNHATTKEYVDEKTGAVQASALLKSGGTMVGKLKLTAEATEDNDAVNKAYVDAILPAFTANDNGKILGVVDGALAWVSKT